MATTDTEVSPPQIAAALGVIAVLVAMIAVSLYGDVLLAVTVILAFLGVVAVGAAIIVVHAVIWRERHR